MKTRFFFFTLIAVLCLSLDTRGQIKNTQGYSLSELQRKFVDLRFGMFIHFNIPTYEDADWPDPQTPATDFNPTKLDTDQWANQARHAGGDHQNRSGIQYLVSAYGTGLESKF